MIGNERKAAIFLWAALTVLRNSVGGDLGTFGIFFEGIAYRTAILYISALSYVYKIKSIQDNIIEQLKISVFNSSSDTPSSPAESFCHHRKRQRKYQKYSSSPSRSKKKGKKSNKRVSLDSEQFDLLEKDRKSDRKKKKSERTDSEKEKDTSEKI